MIILRSCFKVKITWAKIVKITKIFNNHNCRTMSMKFNFITNNNLNITNNYNNRSNKIHCKLHNFIIIINSVILNKYKITNQR